MEANLFRRLILHDAPASRFAFTHHNGLSGSALLSLVARTSEHSRRLLEQTGVNAKAATHTIFVPRDIGIHDVANLPEFVLEVLPGGLETQVGDKATLPAHQLQHFQCQSRKVGWEILQIATAVQSPRRLCIRTILCNVVCKQALLDSELLLRGS
jgi:hypothetical protein